MQFRKAAIEDMSALCSLINRENKSSITPDHLMKWYWENPFRSSSIILCESEGEIQGVSSTNNFIVDIEGTMNLVAFPQKVLTSEKIRGKGVFKELYQINEKDDIDNENVDCFLTFTNEMSTPIFLNKFGYARGVSPLVVVLPSLPCYSISRDITTHVVDKFDEHYLKEIEDSFGLNCIAKDVKFISWRYTEVLDPKNVGYQILEIKEKDKFIGYSVIKRHFLFHTPWFYIMEVICSSRPDHIANIISATRRYGRSKWSLGMIAIVSDLNRSYFEEIKVKKLLKNKFNFLVKGRDRQKTQDLTKIRFNFSLGDLDFI